MRVRELKKGVSPGEDVQRCQVLLRDLGYFPRGRKTGKVYGLETRKAVRAFKRKNGLPNDGICGKRCWQKLEEAYARRHGKKPPKVRMRASVSARRRISDARWGGSRYFTNRINDIVQKRHPGTRVTSRKRFSALLGNDGSDHNTWNRTADAIDHALINDYATKNAVSRALGGPDPLPDYGVFYAENPRNGRTYRIQLIAGDHGTGPHHHSGVKRT